MTQLEFYQEALTKSAEALLNANAQVQSYAALLAKMKKDAIAEKMIGEVYNIDALMQKNHYKYKDFAGKELKCVVVKSYVEEDSVLYIKKDTHYNGLINIEIIFLADPDTILNSKQKVTDKEKELLKKLSNFYAIGKGNKRNQSEYDYGHQSLTSMADELYYLKHKYRMSFSLTWQYSFEKILSGNFLTSGLKAVQTLC